MLRARGLADRLFHQRSAEVVRAGHQRDLTRLEAHLHPRDLHVLDPRPQEEARDGDQLEVFGKRGAGAGALLVVEPCLVVDEAERHELREAARAFLDVAKQLEVTRDVRGRLDVAVHQGRGRAQADLVRGGDDLDPALGHELARREDLADLVVEDLGRGAGDRAESLVLQHGQVVAQRHAVRLGVTEVDLFGRERMDVKIRQLALDRAHDLSVPEAVLVRVDAPLDADLGCSALDRLARVADDLLERAVVGVVLVLVPREAAEAAADVADVGEIDVAADHVGDLVADVVEARAVGHRAEHLQVAATRAEEDLGVRARQLVPVERPFEHRSDGRGGSTQKCVREARSRRGHQVSSGQPRASVDARSRRSISGSKKSGRSVMKSG